jgi:hypothetical protein
MIDMRRLEEIVERRGWPAIDGDPASDEDVRAAAVRERAALKAEAQIFLDCFGTEAGKRALALIRERTIGRPPTADELAERDPAAAGLAAARRMGAANLIFHIEAMCDVARGLADEPETTHG